MKHCNYASSEVFQSMLMKILVFWVMMQCQLANRYGRFEGASCLQLQGICSTIYSDCIHPVYGSNTFPTKCPFCLVFISIIRQTLTYRSCTRVVPKVMSNFFLHANWEQQTKESAVIDGTSCCVILQCLVTSVACIT